MINRDLTLIVNNGAYTAAALKTKDPYIINDFCLSL